MLKIYVDAATKGNPGPSGAGVQLINSTSYQQLSFPLPVLSNHQAEFLAFQIGLEEAIRQTLHLENTIIYTDSKIVAQTIDQDYTTNPQFKDYLAGIRPLLRLFPLIVIQWLPEKENKGADNLARQGLQKALKHHS